MTAPGQPYPGGPGPQSSNSSGCLKWGLIGGGVLLVLALLAVGLLAVVGPSILEAIDNERIADLADYDLTTEHCGLDETGTATANGSLTNTSGKAQGFKLMVRFIDSNGTLIGGTSAFVDKLDQGQKGTWSAIYIGRDPAAGVRCDIEVRYSIID